MRGIGETDKDSGVSGGGIRAGSAAKCAALLTLAVVFTSCFFRYEKEREPNDSQETAQILSGAKTLKGTIGTGQGFSASDRSLQDVDFYAIPTGKAGGKDLVAAITVIEKGPFDVVIKLYEGNRVIKVVDDTSGRGEKVVNVLAAAEGRGEDPRHSRLLFSIEPAAEEQGKDSPSLKEGSALSYELDVRTREREANEEGEPNDKMARANGVDPTRAVKGFFSPGFNPTSESGVEEDWFSFVLEGTDGAVFHLSHSAVPNVDSVLAIYDELGYLLRESNSRGIGEPEKLKNLALPGGRYYIRLASAVPYQQNPQVGYLLKIEKGDGKNRESEPNDRYPSANLLSFFQDTVGTFNPAGDADWFVLKLYEPGRQVLTIRVSPTAEIDPVLELYDNSERMLLRVDDRAKDEGEIIKNIGVEQGVYYLKLHERDVEADNPDRDYTLVAEKRPWQEEEEYEKNDSFESADTFTLGGLKKGYISPAGDRDIYSFHIDRASRIAVEVTPVALIDLSIAVYNQQGEPVAAVNNGPVEEGERASVSLPAGTYYLEVAGVNGKENSRDAYILRINKG